VGAQRVPARIAAPGVQTDAAGGAAEDGGPRSDRWRRGSPGVL